jgi:DNA invertase Pin-like site-specific DNA recombinase
MKIGYVRVSTLEQNLDLQIDALKAAGCEKIIKDEFSGSVSERPGINKLRELLRKGDTLIVWRLDRLGRTLRHLIEFINELQEKEVAFQSLQESINTGTSSGQLIFHIFASLAEFERNLIRERTKAGLEAARARGRQGGRPKQLDDNKQKLLLRLYKERQHPIKEICTMFDITKPTLYRYVRSFEGN